MTMPSDNINLEQDIDLEIDLDLIIEALVNNQSFINQLIQALTKNARGKGNLFGTWAQKQPAPVVNPPQAIKRLN